MKRPSGACTRRAARRRSRRVPLRARTRAARPPSMSTGRVPGAELGEQHGEVGARLQSERRHDDVVERGCRRVVGAERTEHEVDRVARLGFQQLEPSEVGQDGVGVRAAAVRRRMVSARSVRSAASISLAPEIEQATGDDVALHLGGAAVDRRGARVEVLAAPGRHRPRRRPISMTPGSSRRTASYVACSAVATSTLSIDVSAPRVAPSASRCWVARERARSAWRCTNALPTISAAALVVRAATSTSLFESPVQIRDALPEAR